MTVERLIIDPAHYGFAHDPLVRVGILAVDPPTLRDNTGLADRVARAAAREWGLESADVPLSLAGDLEAVLKATDYRPRVACEISGRAGRLVAVETPEGAPANLGVAVDIGSTSLALALVDLDAARLVGRVSAPNPQTELGTDILTRVQLSDKRENYQKLSGMLREAVNRAVVDLCGQNGVAPGRVCSASVAGNTVMTHFFLGLPVRSIVREPYVPVANRVEHLKASELGLNIAPEAPVLVMPNKGAYFGGDLMAGLAVSGLSRAEAPSLLVDVGTNAEVVLGQKDWLLGAAGAAGPALEGGVASKGMIAGPGAIEWVRIDRRTHDAAYRTIGNEAPRGLCGSGLIDLLAELFLSGIIDFRGKLTLPAGHPRRVETDEGSAFLVVPAGEAAGGEAIIFSEIEIDVMLRSKAAMYTILTTLVGSVGLSFQDLDRFYVAGAFGEFIDPEKAVAIGMLPDIPLEKYIPLGNSSLQGAALALLSGQARGEIQAVWKRLTYLEMNVNQDLMNRFSAARFMPHTDRKLFPSVGAGIV